MPPVVLPAFPEKTRKTDAYAPLFDGQCWKVDPQEYDYDVSEIKAFVSSLKSSASKSGCYLRVWVTLDNHVILQRRPADYVPASRRKKTV